MKTSALLAPWKGDKRYTEIAKRATALKKRRLGSDAIVAALSAEFGAPAERGRLRELAQPATIVGQVGVDIEPAALAQLDLALRLPVAIRGALMPDAHVGYALPIGGVLALHRAVAPAMVGVDIGCRMHLSIFAEPPAELLRRRADLFADLRAVTFFGAGASRARPADHPVLADARWKLSAQTAGLRAKGAAQLGTSGGGNHFAELIVGERLPAAAEAAGTETALALPERFWGLLTHSGSRGIGYAIATHYARLAVQETAIRAQVPRQYEWLDLDADAGREYWAAMELAGAYAQANHEVIHAAFARRARLTPLATVQNHHNFAWRQDDLVIHRKGATPAEAGVLGVIPGSMATASYLVAGLGRPEALWSASHGAGRRLSRSAARDSISLREVRQALAEADILVEGLGADEAPAAYKDIEQVMRLQVEAGLIAPLARMHPVAVIMAGAAGDD